MLDTPLTILVHPYQRATAKVDLDPGPPHRLRILPDANGRETGGHHLLARLSDPIVEVGLFDLVVLTVS